MAEYNRDAVAERSPATKFEQREGEQPLHGASMDAGGPAGNAGAGGREQRVEGRGKTGRREGGIGKTDCPGAGWPLTSPRFRTLRG